MILPCRQKILKIKKELLQLINEFIKVEGYKINIQKSVAFPYTNSEQFKKEIKKRRAFTMISVLVNLSCYKTKYCRPGGSNNAPWFFTILEAEKFEVRVPAWVSPSENPPAGWQMAISCCTLTCWSWGQRKLSLVFFYKGNNCMMRAPHPWPNCLPKAPSANTIALGLGFH